jgi:hypothetical protein
MNLVPQIEQIGGAVQQMVTWIQNYVLQTRR